MYLLGDSAFVNNEHMVTTFEIAEYSSSPVKERMNKRLSAMRYIVEMVFGILKCRFMILRNPIQFGQDSPATICHLILALCLLHNYLLDTQDAFHLPEEEIESIIADYRRRYPAEEGNNRTRVQSSTSRDMIERYCEYYNYSQ